MRRRRRRSSLLPSLVSRTFAAFVLGALAIVEALHDVGGVGWPGFVDGANAIGFVLVPLFAAGAVAALSARRSAWWLTAVAGVAAMVHGVVVRLAGARLGEAFIAGGAVTLLLLAVAVLALAPRALRRARTRRLGYG